MENNQTMKDAKEKAKELVEQFYNQPINFPYVDSEDGRCIGAGYMTHNTAKQCALIAVRELVKESYDMGNNNRYKYFQEVEQEIEKL